MATGVTTQKNSLGEIVLVASLFLVWDWLDPHPARTTGARTKIPWDLMALDSHKGGSLPLKALAEQVGFGVPVDRHSADSRDQALQNLGPTGTRRRLMRSDSTAYHASVQFVQAQPSHFEAAPGLRI